jgi:hypothetical protein
MLLIQLPEDRLDARQKKEYLFLLAVSSKKLLTLLLYNPAHKKVYSYSIHAPLIINH